MRKIIIAAFVFTLAVSAAKAERVEYVYDTHGRLVNVHRCSTGNQECVGEPGDVETDYTYDKTDNRTEKEVTVHPPR